MSSTLTAPHFQTEPDDASVQQQITTLIDKRIAQLPDSERLTNEERRGIIARYSSVLEGNFIYWMTATLLAVKTEDAKPILLDNLYEEVRDSHPAMLRRFYAAADAFPTVEDAQSVTKELTEMRLFLGRLSPVQSLLSMAYFEGYIQRFMPYLATLAAARGSEEMEYTDVHGVCDIAHTEGLFQAFFIEREANPLTSDEDLFEGANLLDTLLYRIVHFKN